MDDDEGDEGGERRQHQRMAAVVDEDQPEEEDAGQRDAEADVAEDVVVARVEAAAARGVQALLVRTRESRVHYSEDPLPARCFL